MNSGTHCVGFWRSQQKEKHFKCGIEYRNLISSPNIGIGLRKMVSVYLLTRVSPLFLRLNKQWLLNSELLSATMIQLPIILDFRIEFQRWATLIDVKSQYKFSEQSGKDNHQPLWREKISILLTQCMHILRIIGTVNSGYFSIYYSGFAIGMHIVCYKFELKF